MNPVAIVLTSLISTSALLGIALGIAWRRFGRARHALLWAAGYAAIATAHVCNLALLAFPGNPVAYSGGAVLGVAGFALLAIGFLDRAGRGDAFWSVAVAALLTIGCVLVCDRYPGNLAFTRMLLNLFSAGTFAVAAQAAWRPVDADHAPGGSAFWMLVANAAYSLLLCILASPLVPEGSPGKDHYREIFLLGVPIGMTGAGLFAILLIGDDLAMRLRRLASLDALTGLLNRRGIEQAVERLVAQAHRHDRPLALVVADLDRFKAVNDRFGHARGDQVLKRFASSAVAVLRAGDLLGRLGGEEFVFVLPESGAASAAEAMERVRARLAAALGDLTDPVNVTASFGIATLGPRGDTLAAMLARADAALYQSKGEGRDRISIAPDPCVVTDRRFRTAWRRPAPTEGRVAG